MTLALPVTIGTIDTTNNGKGKGRKQDEKQLHQEPHKL